VKVQEGVGLEEMGRLFYYNGKISKVGGLSGVQTLTIECAVRIDYRKSLMGDEGDHKIELTVIRDIVLPMCELPTECLEQLFKVKARTYPFRNAEEQVIPEKYSRFRL
jgi:hypothetical protein